MAGVRTLIFILLGFGMATMPLHAKDPFYQAVSEMLRTQDLLSSVEEAKGLVDRAYRLTQERLRERLMKGNMDPAFILMSFKQALGGTRQVVQAADSLHVTLSILKEKLQSIIPGDFNVTDVLSPAQMQTIYKATGCARQEMMTTQCDDKSPYRTITGECNNKRIPTLGANNRPYARWLLQEYEDGVSLPRGWDENKLYFGFPLPLVRDVSNKVVRFPNNNLTEDRFRSVMFMQWGQFLDHDLDFGPSTTATLTFLKGAPCDMTCEKALPCFPIKIPPDDPSKSPNTCIPFTRAAPACNGGYAIRNQINALTPFIDASMVYASEEKWAQQLRNLSNQELLAVNQRFTDRGLPHLPFGTPEGFPDNCNKTNPQRNIPCFFAGDNRVNEMPALTTLHTLFLREHNRIANELKRLNPNILLDGDTLFQEVRKIIGAVLESITFSDYLPALLGSPMNKYEGYNDSTDPRVASIFTNVFRFGHASVRPTVFRLDSRYQVQSETPLEREFFATWRIIQDGIDPIVRGLLVKPAKRFTQDQFVVDALRDKLFEQVLPIGLDLPALNMQRGRDHGLPGYNAWRRFCGLSQPRNEAELATVLRNPVLAKKLIQLYKTPNNIDIWVGGLSEPQLLNGRVGPLFACIIRTQFQNIRSGDRFWWENPGVFTLAQRQALSKVSLARIICDNTHLREVPYFPFKVNRYPQDFVSCKDIPRLSLFPWKRSCEFGQWQRILGALGFHQTFSRTSFSAFASLFLVYFWKNCYFRGKCLLKLQYKF